MTTSLYADRRFSQIDTEARLPDGRMVRRSIRYPDGADYAEYQRLDDALVRAFGTVGSRTTGYFMDDDANAVVKSDYTRRDNIAPVPCIACGRQLDPAANDESFDHIPHRGTLFETGGHYGSTAFDSCDGFRLQIVVCDDCLKQHAQTRVRLVDPQRRMTMWDGETDGYAPGSPEYEQNMQRISALIDPTMLRSSTGDGF